MDYSGLSMAVANGVINNYPIRGTHKFKVYSFACVCLTPVKKPLLQESKKLYKTRCCIINIHFVLAATQWASVTFCTLDHYINVKNETTIILARKRKTSELQFCWNWVKGISVLWILLPMPIFQFLYVNRHLKQIVDMHSMSAL